MNRRVLALQPWDAGSHAAVRRAIERHGRLDWRFHSLPGRSPRWRMRHGAIVLAERIREQGSAAVDAIFATSMMSLSDLRALLPESLRRRPHILYMHENQAVYPPSPNASSADRDRDAHLLFTNLASIEAADRVVWNSQWNRDSFVDGIHRILMHAPEPVSESWRARLAAKSVVVPPPVEASTREGRGVLHNSNDGGYPGREVVVAWPHRWEHDKGCEALLELADRAWSIEIDGGPRLRWCLLGNQGPRIPEPMRELCRRHASRIVHVGHVADVMDYRATLRQCDWVLSTANHEFFGIAVAEALLEGCLPWLPRRLSYPELVPEVAFEIDPWRLPVEAKRTASDRDLVASVREGIRSRLDGSIAENAIARLESVVETAVNDACVPGA